MYYRFLMRQFSAVALGTLICALSLGQARAGLEHRPALAFPPDEQTASRACELPSCGDLPISLRGGGSGGGTGDSDNGSGGISDGGGSIGGAIGGGGLGGSVGGVGEGAGGGDSTGGGGLGGSGKAKGGGVL
jgi:hypothetical protein